MAGYYAERLAAERLRACYDLAPPRVATYLESEIAFVLERTSPAMTVLELGCGYGRVLARIAPHVRVAVGIDTSLASLRLARAFLGRAAAGRLVAMDATRMHFRARSFDVTFCVQNGICAFGVDPVALAMEAVRVTRPGGMVLFSSYASRFWQERLDWFRLQAAHGLIGEIDEAATGGGVIVCRDGFRATTMRPEAFEELSVRLGLDARIAEVDGSSLFCELVVP